MDVNGKTEETSAHALSGDAPLSDPTLDRLGYAPFAKTVARSIGGISDPEGFVYAINGPWGSGKTTVVNFVLHELKTDIDDKRLYVVRFNPWWFTGQEDLTRAFFSELLSVVGEPLGEKAETALKKFVKSVSGAQTTLKLAFSVLPGLNKIPEDMRDAALEQFGIVGEGMDTDKSLFDLKDELAGQLRTTPFRTLVIIDDIDRLTADEQLQIFKLVKSVADLPNILYLLVFDDRLAETALSNRPEFQGGAYLEKIVQAPFDLPAPSSERLGDWFLELLNEVIADREVADLGRWLSVWRDIVRPVVTTPRAVTKLINAIRVAWPVVGDNVDLADFVAIETTRLFNKSVFDLIQRNRGWLIDVMGISSDKRSEESERILAQISEGDRDQAKKTLTLLFPRFATSKNGFVVDGNAKQQLAHRRICHPDFFDVYFQFAVDPNVFSAADWESLLEIASKSDNDANQDVGSYLSKLNNTNRRLWGTKSVSMLEALSAAANDMEPEKAKALLILLLRYGDVLLTEQNLDPPFFHAGVDFLLPNVCLDLLDRITDDRREGVLTNAFASTGGFVTSGLALTWIAWTIGRHLTPGDSPSTRAQMIEEEAFERLEALWLGQLEEYAADYSVLNKPLAYRTVINRWSLIAGLDPVKSWLQKAWSEESKRIDILSLVTLENKSSDRGRYPVVDRNHLKQFISVSELEIFAVDVLKQEEGDSAHHSIAAAFLEGVKNDPEKIDES